MKIIVALLAVWPWPVLSDWGPREPLPAPLNTGYEGTPCINATGDTIYFIKYDYGGNSYDIYYSQRVGESWTPPVKVPGGVNSTKGEYAPCISWDGNTLFFDRQIGYESYIYYSEREGNTWGPAKPVPGLVNRPGRPALESCISADKSWLFFVGVLGTSGMHILASRWTNSGWGEPILLYNLGTPYTQEVDPAITYDGEYLYYAQADGLYRARRTAEGWGDPERLGPNINSPTSFEDDPSLTADGRYLYFSVKPPGSDFGYIYFSRWECEPAVSPTSLGKIKALYR